MEIKRKIPKCWVCKDSGLVPYSKYKDKIEYEFAYKCICLSGQDMSPRLITVPSFLAKNLATENYLEVNMSG